MKFTVLPYELQDLVCDFAFKITHKDLKDDLETICTIKSWDLDPQFVQKRVWVREYWCFEDNPLENYFPLRELSSHFEMFNMYLVYELLDRLDFRKKAVRCMGPRERWFHSLDHLEFLGLFSMFHKHVRADPTNIKPAWRGISLFL